VPLSVLNFKASAAVGRAAGRLLGLIVEQRCVWENVRLHLSAAVFSLIDFGELRSLRVRRCFELLLLKHRTAMSDTVM